MCDVLNLDVPPPINQIDMVALASSDFRRDQGDWQKFEALDWLVRVLAAKWSAYAAARRVNACREDRGIDHDEVVDLLG